MMNGEGPLSGSSEWRGFLKSSDVGEEENKSWFPPPAKKARRFEGSDGESLNPPQTPQDKLSPSRNIDFSDFLRTSSNSPALTTSGGALTLSDGWNAPPPQEWQAFLEQMKSGVPPGIVLTSSQLMNLENSELSLSASPSITASPSSLQVDEGSFQPQTSYGAGKEKLKLDQETVKKEDQEDRSALRDNPFSRPMTRAAALAAKEGTSQQPKSTTFRSPLPSNSSQSLSQAPPPPTLTLTSVPVSVTTPNTSTSSGTTSNPVQQNRYPTRSSTSMYSASPTDHGRSVQIPNGGGTMLHSPIPSPSPSPSSSSASSSSSSSSSQTQNPYYFPQHHHWKILPSAVYDLNELYKSYNEVIKPFMSDLRTKQKQTPVNPRIGKNDSMKLVAMHSKARSYISDCLNKCSSLLRSSILMPFTIQEANCLERDLRLELEQLELYELELDHLKKRSTDVHCIAKLVIAKQPFPKPIKKGTTVSGADGEHEEPTLVRLLTASKVCYSTESKVTAEVVSEDSKKGEEVFVAGERSLDEEGFATFYDLKFAKPTRLNIAHLFFTVRVRFMTEDKYGTLVSIRSPPSAPFVVITNESQWGDSEGLLMKIKAFDKDKITFEHLANLIQSHFIRSTRQDMVKPERPLSINDLNFLAKTRFQNKKKISKEDYDDFWNWFGLACRRIRHQLPFHSLWMKGLVLGFITRKEADLLLSYEERGTFLIRFSERNFGKIVISYVKWNEKTERNEAAHFLLAYGPREAPKHLQQVLEKKTECVTVLKITTEFDPSGPLFTKEPKESCFKDFRKGTTPLPLSSDYEFDESFNPN